MQHHSIAMDKTKGYSTPGGRPAPLENPPSQEVGSTDSGESHLLQSNDAFKKSTKLIRSPSLKPTVSTVLADTTPTLSAVEPIEVDNDEQHLNYYDEWKKEVTARKSLEKTVSELQQLILKLEKKIQTPNKNDVQETSNTQQKLHYSTDEEELTRETDWILKKSRRPAKKRKAQSSPESVKGADAMRSDPVNKEDRKGKKQQAPPPIIITDIVTFSDLRNLVKQVTNNECKYTSYNNNMWKVNVNDGDTYRVVTENLNKNGTQWHSYENKATRPIKVMARGLHPSCDEQEIVEDLKEKDFQILEAKNILKKEVVENRSGERVTVRSGMQLFMLSFHHEENIEKIFSIKSIMGIGVKIEAIKRNSKLIPQCKRCQAFGHTQGYCKRNYICVKCAGRHPTKECQLKIEDKPKCVNCRGEHPASYRGCLIAKTYQERKKNQRTAQQTMRNKIVVKNPKDDTKNILVASHATNKTKTYASIIKNQRKEEENATNDILNCILQRLENQEKLIKQLSDEIRSIKAKSNKTPVNNKNKNV